jgi:glycogen synthase
MGPAPDAEARAAVQSIPGVRVFEKPFRLEWMPDPWDDVEAAGEWLLKLERELAPDVVHLNSYSHAALFWTAPVVVVGHSCVLSWWQAVHGEKAPAEWTPYAERVQNGLRAADLVVAPSAAMLSVLRLHHGPLANTRVIHNGRCEIAAPRAGVTKEPIVFTAGRLWDEAKNLEAVCAIASSIAWPVYVAGDARRPDGMVATFDGVHCLGRLSSDDVMSWMYRSAIYALPARYEPFGLSALEAARAGCALVLGDIDSLREVWGDAATYVRPNDHAALATAVQSLAQDDQRRQLMAGRAQARAAHFTTPRMGDGYLDAYRSVLSLAAV